MKKTSLFFGLVLLSFLSVGQAENTTTYTEHPTGTSTEGTTYPKAMNRTDRRVARENRKSMAMSECESTNLQCLHNLKTGPGQDSYQ